MSSTECSVHDYDAALAAPSATAHWPAVVSLTLGVFGLVTAEFLPASLLGMCGYWLAGLWTAAVTRYYLWSLPLALAAILLGRAINRRMKGPSFLRYVHVGLLLVGAVLLIQSARR